MASDDSDPAAYVLDLNAMKSRYYECAECAKRAAPVLEKMGVEDGGTFHPIGTPCPYPVDSQLE